MATPPLDTRKASSRIPLCSALRQRRCTRLLSEVWRKGRKSSSHSHSPTSAAWTAMEGTQLRMETATAEGQPSSPSNNKHFGEDRLPFDPPRRPHTSLKWKQHQWGQHHPDQRRSGPAAVPNCGARSRDSQTKLSMGCSSNLMIPITLPPSIQPRKRPAGLGLYQDPSCASIGNIRIPQCRDCGMLRNAPYF